MQQKAIDPKLDKKKSKSEKLSNKVSASHRRTFGTRARAAAFGPVYTLLPRVSDSPIGIAPVQVRSAHIGTQ